MESSATAYTPDMAAIARFAAWGAIGAVGAYGLLYLFSPIGIALIAVCIGAFSLLRSVSQPGEPFGLLVGVGAFCALVAYSADEPVPWVLAAGLLAALAFTGAAVSGRRDPT